MNAWAQGSRRRIPAGGVLLAVVLAAGCAAKAATPNISRDGRRDVIARAKVWRPTTVAAMDLGTGPGGSGAFAPGATVDCRFVDKDMSGSTPKFTCRLPSGRDIKVKYGRDNGEVYAEVAASRILWALGFTADAMYPVRVRCHGCEGGTPDGDARLFDPATIERKVNGRTIADDGGEGWSWPELDALAPKGALSTRAQRDALKLLAAMLQHTDSKREQQRFICLDPPARGEVNRNNCERPFLMIADLGKTFGKANTLNRDEPGSVNLKNWREERVWREGAECVGNMPKSLTGTLENPIISEAGRRFLAGLLARLSDRQMRDLFQTARFPDRLADGEENPGSVQDWVDALKGKIAEVVNRDCSQPRQAADAR
jgi:hypothetical protein